MYASSRGLRAQILAQQAVSVHDFQRAEPPANLGDWTLSPTYQRTAQAIFVKITKVGGAPD